MIKYFSLPDYWNNFFLIQALIQYKKTHPEYFYIDRNFNSAYGFPPNSIWNGGRAQQGSGLKIEYEKVYNYFSSLENFHLRHTCTNMILDKDMIKDPKCNMIINNYYQTKDYIIISNQQLHDHLKDIVPESHFIYSTTLGIKDINLINTLSKNNIVVLDYNYNNNDNILQQLSYPQNIEILCAELCIDNCPYRREHYRAVSKQNAHLELNQDELELMPCKMKDKLGIKRFSVEIYLKTFKHAINNERIEKLSQLGFQYFKIAGRGRSLELCLQFLIYYLILPQYAELAYNDLLLLANKIKLKNQILGQS